MQMVCIAGKQQNQFAFSCVVFFFYVRLGKKDTDRFGVGDRFTVGFGYGPPEAGSPCLG
jgi:hypothetical protein